MRKLTGIILLIIVLIGSLSDIVAAANLCATPEQAQKIREFYAEKPGTMPVIATRALGLPEAVVTSGLPAGQAVSVSADAFAEVWASMSAWEEAVFLIMKGNTVFEILTGVGEGKPSETSDYFNIEYKHALRGHLRPDQYESIYAISIPGRNDVISRGVLVYDAKGTLVFGAFISGDVLSPSESELTKFDELWAMIQAGPSVCPAS